LLQSFSSETKSIESASIGQTLAQPISSQLVLKTTAKSGWLFLSNLIFVTLLGTILNWTALLFLSISIWRNACHSGAIAPHASGAGAIIALVFLGLVCFKPVGLTLLFGMVFPFLYFLVGKSRGVKRVVAYLLRENQPWIFERMRPVITKMVQLIRTENEPNIGQSSNKTLKSLLNNPGQVLENAPGWLRYAVGFLWRRSQPSRWIHEITGLQDKATTLENTVAQVEARLQEKVSGATQVDSKDLMILLPVNVAAIAMTYWLV
jgi:hypothetical protein